MTTILYECPHCRSKVEVQEDLIDHDMHCPSCQKPFHAKMPEAGAVIDARGRIMDGHDNPNQSMDEEPVLEVFHTAEFRQRPLQMAGLVVAAILGFWALVGGYSSERPAFSWLGVVMLLAVAGAIGYLWILSLYTTLTITTERTIFRRGIISKQTSEVQHDDIRNIQLDQSIVERLLGIGTLAVSSAGQSGLEIVMHAVPQPQKAVQLVREHQARVAA